MSCYKCELLGELYEQVPQTPRNYWVMTELFVLLHDGDVCDEDKEEFEMAVKKDASIEIAKILPSHKFVFVKEIDGAQKEIGYISWESGQLSFDGDFEKSARILFQFLKPYIDEYIANAFS